MTIDKFDAIGEKMDFSDPNLFYFIQIIKRKKDNNPDTTKSSKLIKSYSVFNRAYLDSHKEEMIEIAKLFNARIYISVNQKNKEKVFKQVLSDLSLKNLHGNFDFANAIDSAIGSNFEHSTKKFLVDIDTKDPDIVSRVVNDVNNYVYPPTTEERIVKIVPTIQGFHIICKPCRLGDLAGRYEDGIVSYQSNSNTLLYYSDDKADKGVLG